MRTYYSKGGGLREWVKQNWVDIANKKKDGSYPKCGRSGGEKRKNYPKCVPIAKARAMSKGQRAGENLKSTQAHMLICTHQQYVQVKLHQVARRIEKKLWVVE